MADGGGPAGRFEALLVEERTAALAADVTRLGELQNDKERVLQEMKVDPPPAWQNEAIALAARANVLLIRQLAELHRALLSEHGVGAVTYERSGRRVGDPRSPQR